MKCFTVFNCVMAMLKTLLFAFQLRMWVNTPTIMSCIVPLRSPIIRYMCTLSEADMRAAAAHNTMEHMWQAIKEPMDSQMTFDQEVMTLVYKCFTSTTLTIRLGSIVQISVSCFLIFIKEQSIC